ncbi:MAG: hypothetical protein ABSF70_09735 [Terracidiphilus sp.]|jgi:hypothetical protein
MTESSVPVPENPIVANCSAIFQSVYKAQKENGRHWIIASKIAGQAYRRAMPSLMGEENIRNFVACVAYGILIDAIEAKSSSTLLQAARVALSMDRRNLSQTKTSKG